MYSCSEFSVPRSSEQDKKTRIRKIIPIRGICQNYGLTDKTSVMKETCCFYTLSQTFLSIYFRARGLISKNVLRFRLEFSLKIISDGVLTLKS